MKKILVLGMSEDFISSVKNLFPVDRLFTVNASHVPLAEDDFNEVISICASEGYPKAKAQTIELDQAFRLIEGRRFDAVIIDGEFGKQYNRFDSSRLDVQMENWKRFGVKNSAIIWDEKDLKDFEESVKN